MSNDRVFIKCNGCGATRALLKHHPGLLDVCDNDLVPWLNHHGNHHPRLYYADLGGDSGFSLFNEITGGVK